MSLSSGARLGPYEIVCAIGAGGMGEVYKARDPRLGRDVAITRPGCSKTLGLDRIGGEHLEVRDVFEVFGVERPEPRVSGDRAGGDREVDLSAAGLAETAVESGRQHSLLRRK